MKTEDGAMWPRMSFLSDEDKRRIHRATLQILQQTGMEIVHGEALALLKDAGCQVRERSIVRIPEILVETAIKTAPQEIEVFDREGSFSMNLGGYRAYFGTGSDLLYTIDLNTQERRSCMLHDVRLAAKLCDGLPNIDFIMSSAHPSDVSPHRSYLYCFQAMVENSQKPIVTTAESRDDLKVMWEIGKAVRNDEASLRQQPYLLHYAEPISPLKQAFEGLDKLLFCAEMGIPVVYTPAPIAGSTAPITIAGHVAQGLAECLCGVVIHQLKQKGAPIIIGMGPAVLDMVSGECSYSAPEYCLAYMATVEMSHFYNLPSWGYAGTSDSQVPDGQATYEAGLMTFLSSLAGANLNHDVGYLDFGKTGSLEMMVITDEIIDQTRRLLRGLPVDEEHLALSVIHSIGPGGHFLTADHTLTHLRATQWRPTLISREGHDQWKASGGLSLTERACERALRILKDHKPKPIDAGKALTINKLVEGY